MDFSSICLCIFCIVLLGFLFTIAFIVRRYLTEKNALRALDIQNKKIELFMQMDAKLADEEVTELVKKYMDKYVLEKFIINDIDFIRKEDIEIMIRDLDKQIVIELSELYIFYIKMLVDISGEDDLVAFVHDKTKEVVLGFVTEFNKTKE